MEVEIGNWISDKPIGISVEGLKVGSYHYILLAKDLYGNSVIDTVIVTIVDTIAQEGANSNSNESVNEDGGTEVLLISALILSNGTIVGISITKRFKRFKNRSNHNVTPNLQKLFASNDSTSQFLVETGINKQLEVLEQQVARLKERRNY